jgi:hypothetical protein
LSDLEMRRVDHIVQIDANERIGRVDRRRFVSAGIGALAALLWEARRVRAADDALLRDVCYWEIRSSKCINDRRLEYRCEVCCAGGVCELVQCGWFDVGPC